MYEVSGVMSEKEYDVEVERDLEKIKRLLEQGYEYICDFEDGPYVLKMFRRGIGVGEKRLHREGAVIGKKTR
jgi:Ser/Thr protein kinase RdoA (MazF antagonist)